MIKKTFLLVLLVVGLGMPFKSNAGIYDDIKRFVQTNEYYRTVLNVVSVLYSYGVFAELMRINFPNVHPNVRRAGSVAGTCVVHRLVDANPGYATVTILGLIAYNLLKN